jgi:hypothetical protein
MSIVSQRNDMCNAFYSFYVTLMPSIMYAPGMTGSVDAVQVARAYGSEDEGEDGWVY